MDESDLLVSPPPVRLVFRYVYQIATCAGKSSNQRAIKTIAKGLWAVQTSQRQDEFELDPAEFSVAIAPIGSKRWRKLSVEALVYRFPSKYAWSDLTAYLREHPEYLYLFPACKDSRVAR